MPEKTKRLAIIGVIAVIGLYVAAGAAPWGGAEEEQQERAPSAARERLLQQAYNRAGPGTAGLAGPIELEPRLPEQEQEAAEQDAEPRVERQLFQPPVIERGPTPEEIERERQRREQERAAAEARRRAAEEARRLAAEEEARRRAEEELLDEEEDEQEPTLPLAVLGITQAGETIQVLVQNLENRETKYAGVGDEVFDYVVVDVNAEGVGFRPARRGRGSSGEIVRLALGQNKGYIAGPGIVSSTPSTIGANQPPSTPTTLAELPAAVRTLATELLPTEGELHRIRTSGRGNSLTYRIEHRVDGRNYEVRIRQDGQFDRLNFQIPKEELPPHVLFVANQIRDGYEVTENSNIRVQERSNGSRWFEIRLHQPEGRGNHNVTIQNDGRVTRGG